MNTETRSGAFRLWLTIGVLLMGAGWLVHRLSFSHHPAAPPESIVATDAVGTDGERLAPHPMGTPDPTLLARRTAPAADDASSRVALRWRLVPSDAPLDAPLSAGQLALETRAPGARWLFHGPLDVRPGGAIDFPMTPAPPFEFRVTSFTFADEMFLVDDRGFVSELASEVPLRTAREATVAVDSRATGQELLTVWIAEAATPALGAQPDFDSPGPRGFEVHRRELRAPFPARVFDGMKRPLVSADGCAWLAVPDRVRAGGGRLFLLPGYDVTVHVDASAAAPVGGIEELSLQLMDEESPRWGSSSISVTLTKALARGGRLEGAFRFRGVPGPVLSAAAEARWTALGSASETQDGSARGFGALSSGSLFLGDDRISLALHPDRPEEIVEGYIEFADVELASQVTGAALYAVGGAVHVDGLFARTLPFGKSLSRMGDGLLRWQCEGLRPGRYAMLLQPLGIYCSVEVESTELGLQTLFSEVPPLVSVGVNLADSDGSILSGERTLGVTAFVAGAGAERPAITRPVEVVGDSSSPVTLEVMVPRGARCFLSISAAGRSAQGEFLAEQGQIHEFRLEPEVRWVTLRRTVPSGGPSGGPSGEAAAPLRWWQQNIFALDERGEEQPIVYRTRTPQGAPGRFAFTAWGLARERPPSSELEVALPALASTLVVRGAFAGAGDEWIDVGPDVQEVLVASY